MSGVTGGQVEATKYVVFRNVTASFFTGYVSDFHEKHQDSALWVRIVFSYVTSIAYKRGRKQVKLASKPVCLLHIGIVNKCGLNLFSRKVGIRAENLLNGSSCGIFIHEQFNGDTCSLNNRLSTSYTSVCSNQGMIHMCVPS